MTERRVARWTLPALLGLVLLSIVGCPPLGIASPTPEQVITPAPSPTFTVTLVPSRPVATPSGTVIPTAMLAPTPTGVAEAPGRLAITILYDNNTYDERLETAWGFSCLVEGLQETILFDTGGDSAMLLRNMGKLGIDPHIVDVIVISHIHYDHLGGLSGFLKQNNKVTVYLPQSLPTKIKDEVRQAGAQLVEVHDSVKICERAYSTGELGAWIKEQSLVIETDQGLVVITGCAHPGVVEIAREARRLRSGDVHMVLGGFHLCWMNLLQTKRIVDRVRKEGVQKVAPCHCSGDLARGTFEKVYGEDFILVGVGKRLEISAGS